VASSLTDTSYQPAFGTGPGLREFIDSAQRDRFLMSLWEERLSRPIGGNPPLWRLFTTGGL
jgi:hypothetical protein